MDTKALRQKVLDLAIHGKLVPQDPNDEPASVLLERIRKEKEQLVKDGKIKKGKPSEPIDEVPFEVPKGWEWVRLNDLAFYKKGPFGSSLTKSMFVPDSPSSYKVYEQKNAIQKDHTLGTYFINQEKFSKLQGFSVSANDIIVSCAGTIGETYVLPQGIRPGIINQALMVIRLYNRNIQDFYLMYFDYMLKENAKTDSKGTAIKNIPPFDILKNYPFPLPPLSEQKRIVAEVEKWFALIDVIENSQQDLNTAIDQAKNKILDLAIHGKLVPNEGPWEEKTLGDIGKWQAGSTPSRANKSYYGGDIPWLKTGDLNDGYIDEIPEYITEKALNETSVKLNPAGSVLIAMYGATIGKIGILTFPATTNQACCACVNPLMDNKYLFYFLLAKRSYFIALGGGGAQPNISKDKIVKTPILLPPLSEQKRIVEKIEQLFAALDAMKM